MAGIGVAGNGASQLEEAPDPLISAESALSSHPEDAHLRGHFGYLLMAVGRVDQAIEVLREGLERAPDDPGLLFALSNAYGRAGRSAEAIDAAERSVAVGPGQFHPQMHAGYLLLSAGLLERAEAAFRIAERLQSDDPRVPAVLADVLERLGRTEEAVAAVDRAVGLTPDDEALIRQREALRGRLAASVESIAGADAGAETAAEPAAEPAPEPAPAPPRAAAPASAPKRGTFSFLGW